MFWYLVKSRILLKFFGLESNGTLWPTSRAHNFGLKWGTGHRFCTWAPSNAPINILKDKNLADCPFKNTVNINQIYVSNSSCIFCPIQVKYYYLSFMIKLRYSVCPQICPILFASPLTHHCLHLLPLNEVRIFGPSEKQKH